MAELFTQINRRNDGSVYKGDYSDSITQSTIEGRIEDLERGGQNFRMTVDLNNLNHRYPQALREVYSYFSDRGLAPSPIRVVDRKTLHHAFEVSGEYRDDTSLEGRVGMYVHDRALVVEDQEYESKCGDDYIVSVALHEAAHSLGAENNTIITVREYDSEIKLGGFAAKLGGMAKPDLRWNTGTNALGGFWEEAFADLTTTRAMRVLNRTQNIERDSNVHCMGDKMPTMFVPNESVLMGRGDVIVLPAEFAMLARTINGQNFIVGAASNFAAYALELLDRQVPGLYDDLLAARLNPVKQRDAIKKIESVRRGLYGQLRELPYTGSDFVSGLMLVREAINSSDENYQLAATSVSD